MHRSAVRRWQAITAAVRLIQPTNNFYSAVMILSAGGSMRRRPPSPAPPAAVSPLTSGRPTMDGNTEHGISSPENPHFIMPLPLSITTETSSSPSCAAIMLCPAARRSLRSGDRHVHARDRLHASARSNRDEGAKIGCSRASYLIENTADVFRSDRDKSPALRRRPSAWRGILAPAAASN